MLCLMLHATTTVKLIQDDPKSVLPRNNPGIQQNKAYDETCPQIPGTEKLRADQ